MIDICFTKIRELNLPGVDVDKINKSSLNIYSEYEERFKKEIFTIRSDNKKAYFAMEIDPDSGLILGLVFPHASNPSKQDEKPTKKKEEMLAQAENYFKILHRDIPANAFFMPKEALLQFHSDAWHFGWGRKEGEYKYMLDCILISINEKNGLVSYGYNFYSQYHPPKKIRITKEKALQIARKNVNKIMRSPLYAGGFEGTKAGDVKSAELMIVNPNYSHSLVISLAKGMNTFDNPYARLAWVVDFACLNKKGSRKTGIAGIMVFVDAETGEVLGGG